MHGAQVGQTVVDIAIVRTPNFAPHGPDRPAETQVRIAVSRYLLARRKSGVQIPSPPPHPDNSTNAGRPGRSSPSYRGMRTESASLPVIRGMGALLSSDDYGVERRANGEPSSVWRYVVEVAGCKP